LISAAASYLYKRQALHILLLLLMVMAMLAAIPDHLPGGEWMGLKDHQLLALMAVIVPVHQVIVALVFRLQLMHGLFTRLFGAKDLFVWGTIFLPLLILRFLAVAGLALSTSGSLNQLLPETFRIPGIILGILLLIPAVYTIYSVFRYFGLTRALGADHFREEYRHLPLENRGMFRYSSNAMYVYALFIMWALALLTWSWPALIAALYQHLAIWIHWYCTEAPDMEVIYGSGTGTGGQT